MADLPRLNGVIRALEAGQHALTCFTPTEITGAVAIATSKLDGCVSEMEHRRRRCSHRHGERTLEPGDCPAAPSSMAAVWHAHNVVSCRKKSSPSPRPSRSLTRRGRRWYSAKRNSSDQGHIRIYADASKRVELLRIRQRNIMDWAGLFDVFDPQNGAKIGAFRRKGWRSWVRDEWHLLDANDTQVGTSARDGQPLPPPHLQVLAVQLCLQRPQPQVGTFVQHFAFIGYKATIERLGWQLGPFDRRLAFAGALLLMAVEAKEDANR